MDAAPTAFADPTRFVLVGPSHAGNVGAAARAMKVMGFGDLVLVAPEDPNVLGRREAIVRASGAADVLERARVVATLDEALDGITFACATAMTARDFGPPHHAPRALFGTLAADADRVAFVFGTERYGLSNDDVYGCHACVVIPTDPAYGSLNLAAAVQILAYDWRQALGGFQLVGGPRETPRADAPAVRGLIAHWAEALASLGFLDPARPRKLLPRLHRLAHRARLSAEEVHILRGIARAIGERSR
jgi:tRNA/rRNA methyltransferase